MNFLPSNLKHLRETLGLGQSEMALKLGLKRSTYANYENGATEPKIEVIHEFVLKFGIDAHGLLFSDLKDGKVMPSSTGDEFHKKGKVIGKVLGKVIGKDDEAAKWKSAYENLQKEMKSKDEIIQQKDDLIEALRGQVEALKLATRAMEAQVLSNDKSHRKAG